jgi:regulator of protease activity HflC (stomatin/prohibitin superfamily)
LRLRPAIPDKPSRLGVASLMGVEHRGYPGRRKGVEMTVVLMVLILAVGLVAAAAAASLRVVKQFERGVVFRFGRVESQTRAPGLNFLLPFADRMQKVNMQIITMPVPDQDGITRDNVTVRVDAVVYYRVIDPLRVAVDVQDYGSAIGQVAQTSLRSIIGKSMLDSPAAGWGVHIDRVEIKDVALPESMKRSMSRQAEAERERRARIITADGELQASGKLSEAAARMAATPAALQLRLLETIVEVAAEKNSTLVLPFPVELLRFLENAPSSLADVAGRAVDTPVTEPSTPADAPAAISPSSPFASLEQRPHADPSMLPVP